MNFADDERAQSVVIGSLLVFTILVLSFSAYQAVSVPNQNLQVESEHYQDVESQFSQVRSNIINAVGSNETRSTAIDLGARYPSRVIALNPPPAAGRLETTDPGNVFVSEGGSTVDICRADGGTPTSRSLVYTPGYNEYDEPRAINYESRVIAREFAGGNVSDQRLVRDDEISLYLLNGTVSEHGIDTHSLEVDGSTQNTMELTNPNITVPSRYDEDTWNDEILTGQSDVTATDNGSQVDLDFTGGDYDVSCAVIGLGSEPEFSPPADGGAGGGGAGGGEDNLNPSAQQETLVWESATIGMGNDDKPSVTFENTGTSPISIQEVRYQFYSKDSQGMGGGPSRSGPPKSLRIEDSNWVNYIKPFKDVSSAIGDIPGGQPATYEFEFNKQTNGNGGTFDVERDDFFVITIKFTIDGETRQATYFIGVSQP